MGIGAGFYKHIERDSLGYAMKAAYSDKQNRMKFSEDAIKQSLPDRVALVYHEGKRCVGFEDQVPLQDSLHTDIYNYKADAVPFPSLTAIRKLCSTVNPDLCRTFRFCEDRFVLDGSPRRCFGMTF